MQSNSNTAKNIAEGVNPAIWNYISPSFFDDIYSIGIEGTEFSKLFNTIIEEHHLQQWEKELLIFRYYLKRSLPFNTPEYDFYWSNADEIKTHNREIQELKEFITQTKTSAPEQVKLSAGPLAVNITSNSIIRELIPDLNKILERLTSLQQPELSDPDIKYKTSHGKKYTETILYSFYLFITNEALPDYTNVERCQFVEDFTQTYGLDYSRIQSGNGQPFKDYLLHTFKRLKRHS